MKNEQCSTSLNDLSKKRKQLLGKLIAYERKRQFPNLTITAFLKLTGSNCHHAVYSRLEHGIPVKTSHYVFFAKALGFTISNDTKLFNHIDIHYQQLLHLYFLDDDNEAISFLFSLYHIYHFEPNDLYLRYHTMLIQSTYMLLLGHIPNTFFMKQLYDTHFLFEDNAKIIYAWLFYQYIMVILQDKKQFQHLIERINLAKCYHEHPVYMLIYASYLIGKDPLKARTLCHDVIKQSNPHHHVMLIMESYSLLSTIKYDFHSVSAEVYNDIILEHMQFHPHRSIPLALAYQRKAFCLYTKHHLSESYDYFISIYYTNPLLLYPTFPYFAYIAQKCNRQSELLEITNRFMKIHPACMNLHMPYIQYLYQKLHHENPTKLKYTLLAMCPFYFDGTYRSDWIVEIFEYEMDDLCQLRNSNLCKRKLTQAIHQYCKF